MRNAFVAVVMVSLIGCGKGKEAPPPTAGSSQPEPAKPAADPVPPAPADAAPAPAAPTVDAKTALAAIKTTDDKCTGKECARTGMGFMKTEVEKALGYFKKGCETGDGISCGMLGLAFKEGLGVAKNLAATLALNTQSCDLGYFKGCYNLGLMLYNGEGVPADEAKGLSVLEKACNGDAYRACGSLADLYLTTDKAKARTLAKRGCDNNDPMSCEVLEKIK
ncbi:MAG TPA: tetratricopeptide repeat protein [Kofleriaceae bacterium]